MRSLPALTDDLLDMLEEISQQFRELAGEVRLTLYEPEELGELRSAWKQTPRLYRNHMSVTRRRRRYVPQVKDFDERLTRRYAAKPINPLTLTRCQHLLADGHHLYRFDNDHLGELEQTFGDWLHERCEESRKACLERIDLEMAELDGRPLEPSVERPKRKLPKRIPIGANWSNPGYKPSRARAMARSRPRIAKGPANATPQGKKMSKNRKRRLKEMGAMA